MCEDWSPSSAESDSSDSEEVAMKKSKEANSNTLYYFVCIHH